MRYSIAALLLMTATPAAATVDYAIDLTSPEHHSGKVSAVFPVADGPFLDVKMAAWRTGRYSILNLANGVSGFAASDSAGRPLRWEKVDKSTWRIHLDRPTAVRVGYDIYGNELTLRTRHIDDSHAYLNASAVFVYADRFRADDVAVQLKVPAGWGSYSGMDSPAAGRFVAANWDILTDSPIETGIEKVTSFSEGGRDYQVTFWGNGNYDVQQVAADLKKIVAQAPSIWPGYPFKRYLFMVHTTDGGGGATEHINSTVIQVPRYIFSPRESYLRFLGTAAHEFVHTWNVKAYRAAGLVPYDYQRENYTTLLWLEEGSTEYFSDHLLLRAGITTPSDYFKTLTGVIDTNRHRPGRTVQSVADASFDEWISPGDRDRSDNAWVNIYSEGQIASWALDIALLQQTGGRVSYRDVHRLLYQRFDNKAHGFTEADILAILRELTGKSWDQWWAANVHSPVTPDFDALLAPVGLRLEPVGKSKAWAGWSGDSMQGGIKLTGVERDGPAWQAGFVPDDILVAIDGQRMSETRFKAFLAERKPGDRVTVSFFRRDQLLQKAMTLGATPAEAPKVVPVARPTAAQKALFQRWLLVPYPAS